MSIDSRKGSIAPEDSNKKSSSGKGSSGAGGGNTETRACAACKYQRRRCIPNCPLAPYFPAENQQQFLNARKLFGLRNLATVLKNMKPPQKDIAMATMIVQANVRASDPVGGCYRLVQELEKQIYLCKAELDLVLQRLDFCRVQALENEIQRLNTTTGTSTAGADVEQQNGNSNVDDALNFYNSIHVPPGFEFDDIPDIPDIPDPSEDVKPPVDGSSSEKVVVPKVENEADQDFAHQQESDLKNAASQFSLRN